MGRPAKFTRHRREQILELLRAGTSRRVAATATGIDPSTLTKWIRRGERARSPESMYRRFLDDVLDAEAHPKMRALRNVYDAIPGDPDLAWRFIEREPGYAVQDNPDDDPGGGHVITLNLDG
jgi:hypothetical protein